MTTSTIHRVSHHATLLSYNNFSQANLSCVTQITNYRIFDYVAPSTTFMAASQLGTHRNSFYHFLNSQISSFTTCSLNLSRPAFDEPTHGASENTSTLHMESFSSSRRSPGEKVEQSSAISDPSPAPSYEQLQKH